MQSFTQVILPMIVTAAVSYLIGSINFSIILSKIISGNDIRSSGSGNAGATNMLRTYGKKWGVVTLLLDVLKGVLCVFLAQLYVKYVNSPEYTEKFTNGDLSVLHAIEYLPYIAGVAVVLGHDFPCFFGFKGGKGVATSLGVVLMLDYKIGLILLLGAVLIMALTRYVSLGSILAGLAFIAAEIIKMISKNEIDPVIMACVVILGGMLVFKHRGNIVRLINGTENKLGAKKEDNK